MEIDNPKDKSYNTNPRINNSKHEDITGDQEKQINVVIVIARKTISEGTKSNEPHNSHSWQKSTGIRELGIICLE